MDEVEDVARLATLLETLESNDEVLGAKAARFVDEVLLTDDPESFKISCVYVTWVLTHMDQARRDQVRYDKCQHCYMGRGWLYNDDDEVQPCPKCQPDSATYWDDHFISRDNLPPR